jgi:acetyl-CoA carboxylase biotin carboxyl carrier protein
MKDFDLSQIFESMKKNDINEVIFKDGGKLYEIRRGGFKQNIITGGGQPVMQTSAQGQPMTQQQQVFSQPQNTGSSSSQESKTQPAENPTNYYELKSPLVGTYYASPKPDSPSFVEVGAKVTKGQTICIVEAMKNFNEIECEVDGIVKEICVKNNDLVEFGKVLFRIEIQ